MRFSDDAPLRAHAGGKVWRRSLHWQTKGFHAFNSNSSLQTQLATSNYFIAASTITSANTSANRSKIKNRKAQWVVLLRPSDFESWIKYWLMWFESLLVFILFKFKKRPNISGVWVVSSLWELLTRTLLRIDQRVKKWFAQGCA